MRCGVSGGRSAIAGSELGLLRGFPHLRHDVRKFLIGSRKGQRAFCLDFEDRSGAVRVCGRDDHIVKGTT